MSSLGDFFGHATVSGSSVAGSATAVQVLPASVNRTKIVFSNSSPSDDWCVRLGGTATINDYSFRVPASGNFVYEAPMHTGSISAIQAVASGFLLITVFEKI